ncbi:MAG: oligoendopeptidase F [Candidatus Zixiibacteriota bacterium]|nr:MAG: oligoendopeptidase F [candidate division Zixibacteria bacterium]
MLLFSLTEETTGAVADAANRADVPPQYTWNLADIYPSWEAWEADLRIMQERMNQYVALKGTLFQGSEQVLKAYRLGDEIGMLAEKVMHYPALSFDLNQKDNAINARLQQAEIVVAQFRTESSWFLPELLAIPEETMRAWLQQNEDLALYRFAILDLYRQQEHVLDARGEHLLSLYSRFRGAPGDAYDALTTADIQFPTVTLPSGPEVRLTPARYQAILNTHRDQADRRFAFEKYYEVYQDNLNTYAALYNAILLRDWATARARKYESTLDAALFGNAIPPSVVENLISAIREGTGPLRRYFELRRRALGLEAIDLYDGRVPLVDYTPTYDFDVAARHVTESVAPLGPEYQEAVRQGFRQRWIDVYETEGKRSGGYSAGVYGVHPFVLMNYNETVDELFTLAHEMGHSLHTELANRTQPFVYAGYTIFVAEVASTLSEALLLDHLLETIEDPRERIVLLQHSIDGAVVTFYTQVLFADYELQAHRLVEQGQPVTAETLNDIYYQTLKDYYGDSAALDSLYRITWARIPHFYRSPYYVYQYATSFAASAQLAQEILGREGAARQEAVNRYLNLLKSGGNDYPVEQLKRAGVDLTQPEAVRAVVSLVDGWVTRLEEELEKVKQK